MKERSGQWVACHLPRRRCCIGHLGDSACPFMFQVHSLNIAKVCHTVSHMHVSVTSMIRCRLAAHLGDNICRRIFQTNGFLTLLQEWERMPDSGQLRVLVVRLSSVDWTLGRSPQYEFMLRLHSSSRHTCIEGSGVVTSHILAVRLSRVLSDNSESCAWSCGALSRLFLGGAKVSSEPSSSSCNVELRGSISDTVGLVRCLGCFV